MMRQRAEMQLLLREVGRDFKSTVQEQKDRTEKLLGALDLSADQEARIRAMIREQGEKNGMKPTPDARRAMWDKIMSELTDEQKAKARQFRRQGR
jgi:Spy/CpxP family protein refolding chaperone